MRTNCKKDIVSDDQCYGKDSHNQMQEIVKMKSEQSPAKNIPSNSKPRSKPLEEHTGHLEQT